MRVGFPKRLAALIALNSAVFLMSGCGGQRYPSPDGARAVVITFHNWGPDGLWAVDLKSTGPLGRKLEVGCFTDDDPATGTPTGVAWASDHEVVIAFSAWDEESDDEVIGESRVVLAPDGSVAAIIQPRRALQRPCPAS